MIRLLGELGPKAADALPVLLDVKTELIRRCVEESESSEKERLGEDGDDKSCCPDYLLEAIAKIGSVPGPR